MAAPAPAAYSIAASEWVEDGPLSPVRRVSPPRRYRPVTLIASLAASAALAAAAAVVAQSRRSATAGGGVGSSSASAGAGGVAVTLAEASSPCSDEGDDCRKSQCCSKPGLQCFEKNAFWAACRPSCDPGLDPSDEDGQPWSCKMLGIEGMWAYHGQRARQLMKNLTLAEKVSLLRGENDGWPADRHGYAGYVGVGRQYADPWQPHGITPLSMNDGPQGYNSYGRFKSKSTQYPALLAVAASFSPATARRYATAIAEEFVAKGANVLLGPDVEVTRATLTGRSFETISGEDPFLGSSLVPAYVKAVQDRGIIVCVKHFLNNNQEIYRQSMNVEVADRTQHEIYLPVFKAAFESGAAAVMCSYNKVYGHYACENDKLLTKFLRKDLGFKGFVLSDWGATHDALRSAKAGLDIDMQKDDPKVRLLDEYHKLPDLLKDGAVTQQSIDEKVQHVLSAMYVAGQFDGRYPIPDVFQGKTMGIQRGKQKNVVEADTTSDAHRAVAYQTIIDGAVLLKNQDSTLPLATGKKVVLVGKYCQTAKDPVIKQGDVFSGGGSGYVATEKQITPLAGMQAAFGAGVTASMDADGAAGADVAVVCAAAHGEEGWDRKDFVLPDAATLVGALRKQSKTQKIVVVASVPGAVTTEWLDQADAALMLFGPGEQVGPAVAALLAGKAAPGGRLPVSLPKAGEKRFEQAQYPGVCPPPKTWCPQMTANFSEGVLIGYRWNDAKGIPAAFPFGFGLAYTDFKLQGFEVKCKDNLPLISFEVANVGGRDGAAVPQLYVGFPSLKPAVRQLRGFQKVDIAKGKKAAVAFRLSKPDWSFFDEAPQKWTSAGALGEKITVSIGTSSADLVWHHALPEECTSDEEEAGEKTNEIVA